MADVHDGSAVLASQGVVDDETATRAALAADYAAELDREAGRL